MTSKKLYHKPDCHLKYSSSQKIKSILTPFTFFHSCYLGFTGTNCSQPTCTSVNNCSAHGVCVEAELCKCDLGYNGTDCSNYSCEAVNYCSGNYVVYLFVINLGEGFSIQDLTYI